MRALNAQLLRDHRLAINDYEALLVLAHADDERLRRADLVENLQLTASGVTRLLEGLEAAGLVGREQCPADGRVTYAVLTDAGRAKLEEASRSHLAAIEQLFGDRFSERELETLADLLARLPGATEGQECTPPRRPTEDGQAQGSNPHRTTR
ncbi:MAG: MarR family transcriptional regulator [Actinomycetota bacterium]|nr:MarR family transcriptional regulator [Actinomycetota bacterium]